MGTRLRHTVHHRSPARHDFSPRAYAGNCCVSHGLRASFGHFFGGCFVREVISFTCNRLFYAF